MSIEQIITVPGMGRSIIDHDPRNRNFPVRGAVFAPDAPLKSKTWRRPAAFDQGPTSECVAYSGVGMFNTSPFTSGTPRAVRKKFSFDEWYHGAQANDEWDGEAYDGTSARGLLRYLTSIGVVKEYRWAFGLDDVLKTLSHWGPVCVGTWWTNDMFYPDAKTGLVTYTGEKVGGHQWQLIGVDTHNEEVIAMNSWGKSWGKNGRFRLKFSTLDEILKDDGDAYTVVTVK